MCSLYRPPFLTNERTVQIPLSPFTTCARTRLQAVKIGSIAALKVAEISGTVNDKVRPVGTGQCNRCTQKTSRLPLFCSRESLLGALHLECLPIDPPGVVCMSVAVTLGQGRHPHRRPPEPGDDHRNQGGCPPARLFLRFIHVFLFWLCW